MLPELESIISKSGKSLALLVRSHFHRSGATFVTPNDQNLQVAYMSREAGHRIKPHRHNALKRETFGTQEVLFIRAGTMVATLFDEQDELVQQIELYAGDTLVLQSGGHGFFIPEGCSFIEVKQGPYVEALDKVFLEDVAE